MRRLLLEEYGPKLVYIKGPDNIVTNSLSRLSMATPSEEVHALHHLTHTYHHQVLAEHYGELFTDVEEEFPHPEDMYPISYK